jgi:hypothetical protein
MFKRSGEHVLKRLSQRERVSIEKFIDRLNIQDVHLRLEAKTLVENIAKVIEVNPELLRPDDKIIELIRVRFEDLDEKGQRAWKKSKRLLGDHLDVGIYGISEEIEQFTDSEAMENNLVKLREDKRPKSEDEWIEFILPMTLEEIISFFGGRTGKELGKS